MQVFSSNANFASNIGGVKEYTLGDPRVICRILSDNLYSNKIGSIVRELSANALDAHRMVGKEDVPFEVRLPGLDGLFKQDESIFSIRDYGPGLSEEDIYSLYTSYGSSSKRNDNSQIGGFGIGSKSPFAYADMFTVTSWNHGTMSKYLCFLNQEGSPCIKKLESGVSDEPSGMQVEIAVKSADDAELFRNECCIQYPFYDVPPAGGGWERHVPVYENEYGRIYSNQKFGYSRNSWSGWHNWSSLYGHVNNSIYKLSWNSSDSTRIYGMNDGMLGYNILPFENSVCILNISGTEVDLSASREEMAFTERTKNAVSKIWEKFIKKAWKDILSDINEECRHSRFEAFWKWKEKRLNFDALKEWMSTNGNGLDCIKKFGLETGLGRYLPIFIVEKSVIWPLLENGLRGYEAVDSRSSRGGVHVAKLVKRTTILKDHDSKLVSAGTRLELNTKSLVEIKDGSKNEVLDIPFSLNSEFRLIFFNKDATFASIKEKAREVLSGLFGPGIVHAYAVDDAETRKKIIEAYGSPDASKCMECRIERKKSETTKHATPSIEKKEQVKVRANLNAFNSYRGGCGIGASEVLQQIRSNLNEEWMTKDEIESLVASGAIVVVTNGISVSEKYNVWQTPLLTLVGCICTSKMERPHKWILLNEASYQKLLNIGFKPLERDYALNIALKLLEKCNVDYEDFLKWAVIELLGDDLMFSRLEDCFGFSTFIAPEHSKHVVSKAISSWIHVKHQLSSKMSGTGRLPYKFFDDEGGFYIGDEKKAMIESIRKKMGWNEILEWIRKNPIIQLINYTYCDDRKTSTNAEIFKQYLKWD